MTSDTLLIIQFFADVMKDIFLGLDSAEFEGVSILDMFLAIMFFRLLVWFILKLLGAHWEEGGEYQEKERPSGGKR